MFSYVYESSRDRQAGLLIKPYPVGTQYFETRLTNKYPAMHQRAQFIGGDLLHCYFPDRWKFNA